MSSLLARFARLAATRALQPLTSALRAPLLSRGLAGAKKDGGPALSALRTGTLRSTAVRALSTAVDESRRGVLMVKTSFNNTIVTLTKENGDVLAWASGGSCGFKKSKRKSALAATSALDVIVAKARTFSLDALIVRLSGPGKVHRELLTRCAASGVRIDAIQNVTPMAHNGCRQPKARRV
ncbi:hypothetical protein T492DRAFT_1021776 [Pavlovales sp. CCMP2436]|nr:hypothetical protein T492DRAFT_1021776 [Pavlovales sp. CCMP2436]